MTGDRPIENEKSADPRIHALVFVLVGSEPITVVGTDSTVFRICEAIW